jgi:hypothetical protein
MQQHNEHCDCGEHGHEHSHSVNHHEHNEHCGCGHTHAPIPAPEGLSPMKVDILFALRQRKCLPVACFTLLKTDDDARHSIALAPVYLSATDDSMEQVKQLGQELSQLEEMDLLTIDYDIPLQNYAYEEYRNSELYAYFVQTVAEAAKRPEATYDTPGLDLGSMALTDAGEDMVDIISKQLDV